MQRSRLPIARRMRQSSSLPRRLSAIAGTRATRRQIVPTTAYRLMLLPRPAALSGDRENIERCIADIPRAGGWNWLQSHHVLSYDIAKAHSGTTVPMECTSNTQYLFCSITRVYNLVCAAFLE